MRPQIALISQKGTNAVELAIRREGCMLVAMSEPTVEDKRNDRVFFWFAGGSLALAFGVLLATIESSHQGPTGFVFDTGGATWAAFAVGAAGGLLVWKLVSDTSTARASSVLKATLILLVLGGLATFLYPLRFLRTETLVDAAHGLVTSAVALTFVGYFLWRIKKALDRDAEENTGVEQAGRPRARIEEEHRK